MTTATWSSRVRHDSDAVYQEWRDEFITKLGVMVAAGKLAADETNITPGAGARPGTNTEQGYAVYHISDSLHGTAPIYLRFGFGTGSGATAPRIQFTHGTSTNGSGVLGGTCLSTIANIQAAAAQTTDTARTSYLCVGPGFFGIDWKIGASTSESILFVCRTVDATGAITATGGIIYLGNGAAASVNLVQAFRYASTAVAYVANTNLSDGALGLSPQARAATLSGTDIQAAVGWTVSPLMTPLLGVCGVLNAEVPLATTFTATLVGSTSHTYIGLSTFAQFNGSSNNPLKTAMLWE